MIVISEYSAMLDKAMKLQLSIQQAQSNDELSPRKIKRMMKIMGKMNAALLE